MKDKNMEKWLMSKCWSVVVDWTNNDCVEKLSVCAGCERILNDHHQLPQCEYVTANFHCGFPEIALPLKSAFILGRVRSSIGWK